MLDKIPGSSLLTSSDVILVTGGTGLFGNAIRSTVEKHKLAGKWIFLSSRDADLRDFQETKKVFDSHKPTYVIHLAAFVGGLFRNLHYKVDFFVDNTNMNMNVLKLCHETKVKKCISCLSTCVFPDKIPKYPFDETILHNGPPHVSNNAYAYSKRMLEQLGHWYFEQYQTETKFTSIIPTNLYGPHDNYNLENGHVLPALMHKCYLAEKKGHDFVVFGTGAPLRQFLYSLDAAELTLWVLCNYDELDPIMLTVGEEDEKSIGEVARMIHKASTITQKMVFDTTKSDGQFKKTASNAKLLKLFPEYKFTPMEKGVEDSVQWFLDNYESARK
jgi:GDP-L-fucose synthase